MLLEQIAERLVAQLLQGLHAVERELMLRVPRLCIESEMLAMRAGGRPSEAASMSRGPVARGAAGWARYLRTAARRC
jgi:hypothetical protein